MSARTVTPEGGAWLTSSQACGLLGVSAATLRRWSDSGELEAFTTPGGHRRFSRAAVTRLLGSRVPGPMGTTPVARSRTSADPAHAVRACRDLVGGSVPPQAARALRDLYSSVAAYAEVARRRGLSNTDVGILLTEATLASATPSSGTTSAAATSGRG